MLSEETQKIVRTRHIQLVDVHGLPVMVEFALWPAGALGVSALSKGLLCHHLL
jgi:hypothetical protein